MKHVKQENRNSNPFCGGFERYLSFCRGMPWKRIVPQKIVAIFLKEGKKNTPIHSVAILAEDLSFCRGVVGGGYTADIQAYSFKTYTPHTQKSEKREREKRKPCKSGDAWVGRYFKK